MQKWRKYKSLRAHNDNLQDKKLENSRHFAGQQVRKSPDPSKPPRQYGMARMSALPFSAHTTIIELSTH